MTTVIDPGLPVETTGTAEPAIGEPAVAVGSDQAEEVVQPGLLADRHEPASPSQPVLAGRYRLDEPLGRGGMGRVYRGHDDLLDRPVAVKLIYDDAVSARDLQRSCAVEARAAARISHPGVVRILDSGFDDGRCFVVMELAEGRTLAERLLEHGALPVSEALSLAAQVADALEAAHRHGVVHCDVKPGNLIVDDFGRVCLVDFGIARVTTSSSGLTDQDIHGSAKYVAPEQVEGLAIDGRTDLYALGVVLFEMLAGRPPFAGGNLASVLAQRLVADPPSVRALAPAVPARIDQIVRKAMAREPDERYQTAGDLREALRAGREALHDTDRLLAPVAAPNAHRERRSALNATTMLGGAVGTAAAVGAAGAATAGQIGRTLASSLGEAGRKARQSAGQAGSAARRAGNSIRQTGGRHWPLLAQASPYRLLRLPSLPAAVGIVALLGLVVGMAAAQCGLAGVASSEEMLAAQPAAASAEILAAPANVEPTTAPAVAPPTTAPPPTQAAAPTEPPAPTAPPTASAPAPETAPAPPPAAPEVAPAAPAPPAQLLAAPAAAAPAAAPPGDEPADEQRMRSTEEKPPDRGNGNGNGAGNGNGQGEKRNGQDEKQDDKKPAAPPPAAKPQAAQPAPPAPKPAAPAPAAKPQSPPPGQAKKEAPAPAPKPSQGNNGNGNKRR